MSYNTDHLRTAGKITVYTSILGVAVFLVAFIFNIGENQIRQVVAQESATTTITVLNTPPLWTATTTELIESSASNPTDAGNDVTWVAVATDSNAERYYLLICSTNATPTANSGTAPACSAGTQWAVSASTTSGTQVSLSTTTTASSSPFGGEAFDWYAWVCDGNAGTPRCSSSYTQGTNATNSSPFEINHRPTFTIFTDTSPADPGQTVTFYSTSSDPDSSGTQDTVYLFVCASSGFNTTTNACSGTTLATSTGYASADASSTYTIIIPTQDQSYSAYGYVTDQHGFEASGGAQDTDSTLLVNNVAPVISSSTISLTQASGTHLYLTVESGQTTGYTLSFNSYDNNSCDAIGGSLGDEITDYNLSIYRSGIGSTTCTVAAGASNPNNCYPSGLATTTWNLSCTASTTSCVDNEDVDMEWNCTFPLWYIADPTDGLASTTEYSSENWLAQVQGIDDDSATGALSESPVGVDVKSFLAFSLNTLTIPYGSLEPGQQNDPLVATTTVAATGNVGIDKDVTGESMCTGYTGATPCTNSATSTIPESEQRFATTTASYTSATPLSSTTPQVIQINVLKSTATSTQATAPAYWGIRVPSSITFAGDYTGENTFTALVSNSSEW